MGRLIQRLEREHEFRQHRSVVRIRPARRKRYAADPRADKPRKGVRVRGLPTRNRLGRGKRQISGDARQPFAFDQQARDSRRLPRKSDSQLLTKPEDDIVSARRCYQPHVQVAQLRHPTTHFWAGPSGRPTPTAVPFDRLRAHEDRLRARTTTCSGTYQLSAGPRRPRPRAYSCRPPPTSPRPAGRTPSCFRPHHRLSAHRRNWRTCARQLAE